MNERFFAHSVLQCSEEAATLFVGLHLTDTCILKVVITLNLQQQIVHLVHWNYQPNPKDEQSKIRNETDIPCTTTSNNWKSFIHLFGWENILKTQPLFHEKKKHLIFLRHNFIHCYDFPVLFSSLIFSSPAWKLEREKEKKTRPKENASVLHRIKALWSGENGTYPSVLQQENHWARIVRILSSGTGSV